MRIMILFFTLANLVEYLTNNKDIVIYESPFNKSIFKRDEDDRHNILHFVSKDFKNNFVANIT